MRFIELVDLVESLADENGMVCEDDLIPSITEPYPSRFLQSACESKVLRRSFGSAYTYYSLDDKGYELKDARQQIYRHDRDAKINRILAVVALLVAVVTLIVTIIGLYV